MTTLFRRHPREGDLALFAGGELGPLARWRIEGHLNGCGPCRRAVSDFFELRSRVMDLGELPQLDWSGMAAGIHRRVERARRERQRAPIWRPAWGAAMAALLLLVLGGYISYRHNWPEKGPTGAISLGATAGAVELRSGPQRVLTLLNAPQQESQVNWRVSAGAVSARYLDKDTGNITVNYVSAE